MTWTIGENLVTFRLFEKYQASKKFVDLEIK